MIDKVDQNSEEYRKWKEGSVTVDNGEEIDNKSIEKTVDITNKETSRASDNENEQVSGEKTVDNNPELKRDKIFFMDWFFGIKTHKGQMKMMYYSFTFFFYYLFCVVSAYLLERRGTPEFDIFEILYLFLLAIPVAIMLPFVLLFMGFTLSGGIFIGMFVGIFSWLFGIGGKFLYKLFGFDMDLLFPEFIGKKGEITKLNPIGKYSSYPYTATISKMGLPGDSILYKNNFSVRSDDELKLGMKVEVIEHEKRSLTSWIKNHPTFLVRPINEKSTLSKEEM